MDALHGIVNGFSVALTGTNLLVCFLGCLLGTIVGVLPGLGPIGAMALLIPSTYVLGPTSALIMLHACVSLVARFGCWARSSPLTP